jgi:2-dehydropantoate 2-reductase
MRAVIAGGGAMGCLFAAELARSGTDVTVLDPEPAVVTALTAEGAQVTRDDHLVSAPVKAVSDPSGAGPADVVFVFVKAHHTRAAARDIPVYLAPRGTVVSLQNGWGNADLLAGTIPAGQLVAGVTYHSCTTLSPGRIAHTGQGPTFVGPYQADGPPGPATSVAGLLTRAGFEVQASSQVLAEIWKKLVLNAATLPVAALTGLTAGEIGASPGTLALVDLLAGEAVAVGQARGLPLDLDERISRIHAVLAAAGAGKPSMLQDVQAHRKTEVEVVNGAVVAAAGQAGVPVPLNEAMVALIHGLERSWKS